MSVICVVLTGAHIFIFSDGKELILIIVATILCISTPTGMCFDLSSHLD